MSKSAKSVAAAAPKQSFDCLEQEVFLNLWRTYDRLKSLEDEVFGRVGLSAQQYNALRLLRSVYPDSMPTLVLGGRLISLICLFAGLGIYFIKDTQLPNQSRNQFPSLSMQVGTPESRLYPLTSKSPKLWQN
jgi:hypothetical protein